MSSPTPTETAQPIPGARKRDASLDALKGFLIVLVLIGHSGIGGALAHANDSFLGGIVMRLVGLLPPIYYFHIALFFSVSAAPGEPASPGKIARRLLGLILLFGFWMCWPALSYFLNACIDNPHLDVWPFWRGNVWPWLTDRLNRTAWGDWSHTGILWFIPTLAVFTLLCNGVAKGLQIARSQSARIIIVTLILLSWACLVAYATQIADWHVKGVIPWGADIAVYLLPLGLLHRWMYQNRVRFEKIPYAALLLGLLAGELLLTAFEPVKTHSPYQYRIDFAQFSVATTPLGIIGLCLLTSSVLLLALRVQPMRLFTWLGRYSLPIYVMHMNFIDYDLIKSGGLERFIPSALSLGSIEGFHYLSRLGAALFMPILISMIVGSIVPTARPLGFIAPDISLVWRKSIFNAVARLFSKRKSLAEKT